MMVATMKLICRSFENVKKQPGTNGRGNDLFHLGCTALVLTHFPLKMGIVQVQIQL